MQELARFVIPLDPRTKKNSHRIAGCGPRCPVCGKFQKQFIRNGKATTEFALHASSYLHPKPQEAIDCPVWLVYRLYTQTHHRKDDLNLFEALDDILVSGKILKDDDTKHIRSRDGSRVGYDKDYPRAEIYIYTYDEQEDPYGKWHKDVHH